MRLRILGIVFFAVASQVFGESKSTKQSNKQSEEKICVSEGSSVLGRQNLDFQKMTKDVYALKTTSGQPLLRESNPAFDHELNELFGPTRRPASKLEQFYALLYWLAKHRDIKETDFELDPAPVRALLLSSQVFSSPEVPAAIRLVKVSWDRNFSAARYDVKMNSQELILPLNQGKGFKIFREGLCQFTDSLVFYGGFSFLTLLNDEGNIVVKDFSDVDLRGHFGSSGILDIDLQYVALRSAEFVKGSRIGIVQAKVSEREFREHEGRHSWLLRQLMRLVTDKSTQPLDW